MKSSIDRFAGTSAVLPTTARFFVVALGLLAAAVGPCAAQSVVLTVGPHGAYPTIEDALNNVVNGWTNEIRIEAGTYFENVVIQSPAVSLTSGTINLYGGWNSTFTAQSADPSLTVIDADFDGTCLMVNLAPTGATTIRTAYLTFANGVAEAGGGISFTATGNMTLDVKFSEFVNNRASATSTPSDGGGLWADISGTDNVLGIYDSSFTGNVARPVGASNQARGAAAFVNVTGSSTVNLRGVSFVGNVLDGTGSSLDGAGLFLTVGNDAFAWARDLTVSANQANGTGAIGVGLFLYADGTGFIMFRQVKLLDNLSATGGNSQLFVWALNSAWVELGDILIAGGATGADIQSYGDASVALTSLTVVDNTEVGMSLWRADMSAALFFENSVLFGNAVDVSVPGFSPTAGHNLIGVNPVFVDRPAGDYRLASGSPAENAGTNSPVATLGTTDCSGGLRVIDDIVDIGAYEGVDLLFSDGFESQNTRRWDDWAGAFD